VPFLRQQDRGGDGRRFVGWRFGSGFFGNGDGQRWVVGWGGPLRHHRPIHLRHVLPKGLRLRSDHDGCRVRYQQAVYGLRNGEGEECYGCNGRYGPITPLPVECQQCVNNVCTLSCPVDDAGPSCLYIGPSIFEYSCNVDADCTYVPHGVQCGSTCSCAQLAVNTTSLGPYDAGVCSSCPPNGVPRCLSGQCAMCGAGPNQPPGCGGDGG
jgi:hypothetical protein